MNDGATILQPGVLRNVRPATCRLKLLGIETLVQLAARDADRLYLRLCKETARRHDPYVHDTFTAAIHQARTGEGVNWWAYTPARKLRQAAGDFPHSLPREPGTSRPPCHSSTPCLNSWRLRRWPLSGRGGGARPWWSGLPDPRRRLGARGGAGRGRLSGSPGTWRATDAVVRGRPRIKLSANIDIKRNVACFHTCFLSV